MDCFNVEFIGYDDDGYFGKTYYETMTEKEINDCYANGLTITKIEPTDQTKNDYRRIVHNP